MFFPHRPFTGNGNNHMQLQCPLCGNTWVHIELADAVCDETTDDYTSPGGTRGEWISIPAWCEADHEWDIVLGFHKGETFVDVTQRRGRQRAPAGAQQGPPGCNREATAANTTPEHDGEGGK
jgi:hypothetical protein